MRSGYAFVGARDDVSRSLAEVQVRPKRLGEGDLHVASPAAASGEIHNRMTHAHARTCAARIRAQYSEPLGAT